MESSFARWVVVREHSRKSLNLSLSVFEIFPDDVIKRIMMVTTFCFAADAEFFTKSFPGVNIDFQKKLKSRCINKTVSVKSFGEGWSYDHPL